MKQLTLQRDRLHHTLTEVCIQEGRGNCHLTCILASMVRPQTSEGVGSGANLRPGITALIVPAVGGGGGAERVCSTD